MASKEVNGKSWLSDGFETLRDKRQRKRFLRKLEIDTILEGFGKNHFDNALELGCGSGEHSQHLAAYCKSLVALEYNQDRLNATSDEKITFMIGDAQDLSQFNDDEMDLVFSSNLIEHLQNPVHCLSECSRVLKQDGFVIHTVPNRTWKIMGLLLYYPYHLKLAFRLLFSSEKSANPKGSKTPRSKIDHNLRVVDLAEPVKYKFLRKLLPTPHGVSKGNFRELLSWGQKHWIRVFRKSGLEVVNIVRLPFYFPYSDEFHTLLKLGNCMGFSSSTGYVLKKVSSLN